jgi:hypothetical protein
VTTKAPIFCPSLSSAVMLISEQTVEEVDNISANIAFGT